MAGGAGFDPAEFQAFKAAASRSSEPARSREPSWTVPGEDAAPAGGGFDPAEFAAFKASASRAAPASFDDRFGSGPTSMSTDNASDGLGHELRRVADERLVGKPDAATPFLAATLRAGNAAGLNLPRNLAAVAATGAGWAGVPGYPSRSFSEITISLRIKKRRCRGMPRNRLWRGPWAAWSVARWRCRRSEPRKAWGWVRGRWRT